ncbi:IS3 family transposase, partial [Granulicatella elegans]|uniref:IS3 family transposase n=1 Tax=Granulicatella elegans TaxID=137732 RepID=UPI0028D046AD
EKAIINYIDYYNNKRIKIKLNGLSPVKYRMCEATPKSCTFWGRFIFFYFSNFDNL